MDKMKIHWVWQEKDPISNALGYGTHNRNMRMFSEPYIELDDNSNMALHIVSADHFCPQPGKKNFLFTMWEFLSVPPTYIKALQLADVVIVPSSFCRDLFRKYTPKPIYVCHEGVDPDKYPFYLRQFPRPGQRFRFLWCGAPNSRKGYPLVQEAIKVFAGNPSIEIYLKTTMQKLTFMGMLKQTWKHRKEIFFDQGKRVALRRMWDKLPKASLANSVRCLGKHKNVIMDTRKLDQEELTALYNSAHCFLLPSLGEGWGLTLCEAMATGCPSVGINVTGCADFFDSEVGYPIKCEIKDLAMENYGMVTPSYIPDTRHFIMQMSRVIMEYTDALKKGHKASDRIRNKFTWQLSAKRLADILQKESIPYESIAPTDRMTAQDIIFNKDREKILGGIVKPDNPYAIHPESIIPKEKEHADSIH